MKAVKQDAVVISTGSYIVIETSTEELQGLSVLLRLRDGHNHQFGQHYYKCMFFFLFLSTLFRHPSVASAGRSKSELLCCKLPH